ncbi:hypothetical protein Zmor_020583 [Zophobas morio]|uniref:Uncharacterized protein n=1 Tax=Zophobas morio TaxID=2755281 RepID=A0AA38I480_9CUCU|nr:hypothetical protein Zmor_020583 [Zophobas morio]
MVNFSNPERVDVIILDGMADGNTTTRFHHLYQWYTICEIMASSLKPTIVVVIEPKESCKLKNKFWKVLKKSPTSPLFHLQLKLGFHSL